MRDTGCIKQAGAHLRKLVGDTPDQEKSAGDLHHSCLQRTSHPSQQDVHNLQNGKGLDNGSLYPNAYICAGRPVVNRLQEWRETRFDGAWGGSEDLGHET